jgi:hypothetical protein
LTPPEAAGFGRRTMPPLTPPEEAGVLLFEPTVTAPLLWLVSGARFEALEITDMAKHKQQRVSSSIFKKSDFNFFRKKFQFFSKEN